MSTEQSFDRRTTTRILVAVIAAVVGFGLLAWAGTQQRLWDVLLPFLLGMVGLTPAFLFFNDWLARRLERHGSVPKQLKLLFVALTVGGGLGLFLVVRSLGPQLLAAALVIVFTGGVICMYAWLGSGTPPVPPSDWAWSRAVGRKTQVGAVLMLLTSVWVPALESFGWFGWVLGLVWLVGLVLVKMGMSPFLRSRHADIVPTLRAMSALTAFGFVLILVGSLEPSLLGVLLGVSIAIGALSVLGLALVHCDCSRRKSIVLTAVGVVGGLVGMVWASGVANVDGLGRFVALLVWGIGTWYVFRGEGIVLLLIVGWIAVWGLADRTADAPADPHDDASQHILAIGDSFMSGEGANEFLPGTNEAGANECRRAETAYAYTVADELGYGLDFFACQGAKIDDLTKCGQMADLTMMKDEFGFDDDDLSKRRSNCTLVADQWGDAQRTAVADELPGFIPQLLNVPAGGFDSYDVVLLSIGGNDAGFSTIVKSCLLPADCADQRDEWLALVKAQRVRLRATYLHLQDVARDDARIIAMPYPPLASEADCGLGLSGAEHEFIAELIGALDEEIKAAAADVGIEVFTGTPQAYSGIDLCATPAGANHVLLEPTEGAWDRRYQPAAWIHGSMHPNELGHSRVAALLTEHIEAGPPGEDAGTGSDAATIDSSELTVDERAQLMCVEDSGFECRPLTPEETEFADAGQALVDSDQWIADELYTSLRQLLPPLLLLLASGLLFAAGFLRFDNPISNTLRPRDAKASDTNEPDHGTPEA